VLAPTSAVFDTSREVEVESRPTVRLSVVLAEAATIEPILGVKKAVSSGVEVPKDVAQVTVTLWPVGAIGSFAHPLIGVPPFMNVISPDGGTVLSLEVTVAIKITVSFVTAALREACNAGVL
jgi:hypothetical protein